MMNWAMLLHRPLQKSYKMVGTEFEDGNMDISDMMWQCMQLGDVNWAMSLQRPLQKSQEISGTVLEDKNINISDMMWQ